MNHRREFSRIKRLPPYVFNTTGALKMAERRLLPVVRAATAETIVVAAGVSCRQQIKHGADRQALHPAQVLRDAML